jgi:hypothetical protein
MVGMQHLRTAQARSTTAIKNEKNGDDKKIINVLLLQN